MKEEVKVKGYVKMTLRRNGKVLWKREGKNLVTTTGLILLAEIISAGGATKPSHMALGSSASGALLSQTALQGSEHERVALSESQVDQSLTYSATFGTGIASSVSVGEFGIFNAGAAGTMLARWITTVFTMGAADTLDVDWTITLV